MLSGTVLLRIHYLLQQISPLSTRQIRSLHVLPLPLDFISRKKTIFLTEKSKVSE